MNVATELVEYRPTSLRIVGRFDADDFRTLARTLGAMERSRQWWIGDLLVLGEVNLPEPEFLDALDEFGLAPHTLVNYRSICSRIPVGSRRETLSFSIHAEVAYLEPAERDHWLAVAERDGLGVRELRELLRPSSGRPADEPEPAVELTDLEDATIAKRLDRIERAFSNGIRYRDDSGETTVEDLLWLLDVAKRFTRGAAGRLA